MLCDMSDPHNDEALTPTEAAAELSLRRPFWRRPPLLIAGGVVVAAALVVGGIALFRPASGNSTACGLYEDAYNKMADSVRLKDDAGLSVDYIKAQLSLAPGRIQRALDKAEGKVAVEMTHSEEYVTGFAAASAAGENTQDVGTAFFLSATAVSDSCGADGAQIKLNEFG